MGMTLANMEPLQNMVCCSETEKEKKNAMISIREMLGQMLIVGFDGMRPTDPGVERVGDFLKRGYVGGVIHFSYNIDDTLEVLNNYLLSQHTLSPILSIDQEGGCVQRLLKTRYKSPKSVSNTEKNVQLYYDVLACELFNQGFNFNYGPCVDLDLAQHNGVIGKYKRSFGSDPARVAECARAFVEAHRDHGIKTCLKHAPGHGSAGMNSNRAEADTHKGFVNVTEDWSEEELVPYFLLEAVGAIDSIMMAHIFNANLDSRWPTSLSPKVIGDMRTIIGGEPIIVTDDICMGAIREHYTFEEAVLQSIRAGNDMIIMSNNPAAGRGGHDWPEVIEDFVERCHHAVDDAIDAGTLTVSGLEDAYARVLNFKLGL